jgi:hypothetical protein
MGPEAGKMKRASQASFQDMEERAGEVHIEE